MKKRIYIVAVLLTLTLSAIPTQHTHAGDPISLIIREAIKKAIKAMDLMIQRLQNVTIKLQNAQKEIENAMSKLQLKEISEWAEKQRELYDKYYKELWQVKNAIAYYQRIKSIIAKQAQLLHEYRQAVGLFKQDKHFSEKELAFMYDVYSGILSESIKNIDEIMLVINSFATQMTDAKRLELIHQAAAKIEKNLGALRSFNQHNVSLSLSRAKDAYELAMVRQLYGIPQN